MAELPSGTVTFLFTDVEGSTRLLHELGDEYANVLSEHRRALRRAFTAHGGVEVDTQGDAFFFAFAKASAALTAAADGRAALTDGPIRVRMGLHTGEPVVTKEGYVGIDVHRAARIAAAGHGGQILVSQSTRDLAGTDGLRDLGEHRLKDMVEPERIYQFGDGDFPPLKTLNNSNLPLPAEPLIGRKKELADVLRLLRNGSRLVTITGPGGIGKTRFALEVASELIQDFSDGVWWVGLAPLREPTLVLPAVATTVGAKDDLDAAMRSKQVLLLLDNFEHVIGAAPELAELQRACASVTLMVTSREPLHVAGEREYPLSPLPESPAVELFRQRAEAIAPGFAAGYRELADLCTRIDGLPLAIELAAARTRVLSVSNLLEHLHQRLGLLTSRRRDVDERQRTLHATIEWSYDLLDEREQEVFANLGVFAGSFDAAAADAVAGAELDDLESLVDKSLLRRRGDGRFFLLETIREFTRERMAPAQLAVAEERHVAYFTAKAQQAAPGTTRLDEIDLGQLEEDHANFVAAIGVALREGAGALMLVGAVGTLWFVRGRVSEGLRWTEAALASEAARTRERDRVLKWAFWFALDRGEYERAEQFATERLDVARELGDPRLIAGALGNVARAREVNGDLQGALRVNEEALAVARNLDDGLPLVPALSQTADLRATLGDREGARRIWEEVLKIADEAGDPFVISVAHRDMGWFELRWGDADAAVRHLAEAVTWARGERVREVLETVLVGLAAVAASRGRAVEAARSIAAYDRFEQERGIVAEAWITEVLDPLREQLSGVPRGNQPALSIDEAIDEALTVVGYAPAP